ncbi:MULTISPECIES: hypothetical protein [unclassified Agarivorans]
MTDEVQDIKLVILRYLQQHPGSEDSLAGITDWWVKRQRFDDSMMAVETALKRMVGEQIVVETNRNGVSYYRFNAKA